MTIWALLWLSEQGLTMGSKRAPWAHRSPLVGILLRAISEGLKWAVLRAWAGEGEDEVK
jgi:hypothetical protein